MLGTFDFYFNGLVEEGSLQVNPLDLLILETLRTFDHGVYLDIRDSLGFNLPKKFMQLLFGNKKRKEEITVEIEALAKKHGRDDAHARRLKEILRCLFPEDLTGETRTDAERDLRVCHPEHFPKYFGFGSDKSATSAAKINTLLGKVDDRADLAARLRELIKTGAIEAVLGKLGLYFKDIPSAAVESFVGALFDVSEEMPVASVGFFNRDPFVVAGRMSYFALEKLPNSSARTACYARCFSSTPGLTVPLITMGMLDSAIEKKGEASIISASDLTPIKEATLNRIREWAKNGKIWNGVRLGLFLYRWRDWAGQAEVNDWLAKELATPMKKTDFIGRMVSQSVVNGTHIEHYLDAKSLEEFVNIEAFSAAIASIPESELTTMQALGRKLLARAVDMKKTGYGYGEVRERGAFDSEPEDSDL